MGDKLGYYWDGKGFQETKPHGGGYRVIDEKLKLCDWFFVDGSRTHVGLIRVDKKNYSCVWDEKEGDSYCDQGKEKG